MNNNQIIIGGKNENQNTYNNILCKINEYIVLNEDDLLFIKILTKEQLLTIIETNNIYTELMNDYVMYDIKYDIKECKKSNK